MNGNGTVVRNLHRQPAVAPGEDRRVRRTRQAIGRALFSLVLEKRYAAITIQDLLDRADVGRSTFYAHYRGKDDLLLRSFEQLLEMLDGCVDRGEPRGTRIAPVRELFGHIHGEARTFHQALAQARMLERLYEAGVNQLTRSMARRIEAMRGRSSPGSLPVVVAARAAAGALFALLRWWLDHDAPYTPEQMDAMFHEMVLSGAGRP